MKSKKAKQTESRLLLPQENPNFFGHADALANMFASYSNGNMPGAWLISGPRGIGKATLAYRFAKFILYNANKKPVGLFAPEALTPDLSIPQNSPTFSKVSIGSHPDLLVLEAGAADSKSTSGDILVDDARKIGNFLHLTSSETPYRLIIIDSIDDMNSNAANSILKLLEEPPANAMFFLISHAPGKLLPTIRSRCRQIKMRQLSPENALIVLQAIAPDISKDIGLSLIELASGSPGNAYDLYINKGMETYEKIIGILSHLPKLDIPSIQKLGDNISGKANENNWRIFRLLLNKIIVEITKQTALHGTTGKNINRKLKLSVAMDAEKLVEVWQEINSFLEDADNLHLERKAMLIKIVTLLGK